MEVRKEQVNELLFYKSRVLFHVNNKERNRPYTKHSVLGANNNQQILIIMMSQGYDALFQTYHSAKLHAGLLSAPSSVQQQDKPMKPALLMT